MLNLMNVDSKSMNYKELTTKHKTKLWQLIAVILWCGSFKPKQKGKIAFNQMKKAVM